MNTKNKNNNGQVGAPSIPTTGPYCQLSVEGVVAGYFYEFLNFGKESEVIQQRIIGAGGQEISQKSPGRLRIKKVVLKREMGANLDMWEWRRLVEVGDVSSARKNCVVTAFNPGAVEIATWVLENAWPISVVSERESTGTNLEVLTLVMEKFYRLS